MGDPCQWCDAECERLVRLDAAIPALVEAMERVGTILRVSCPRCAKEAGGVIDAALARFEDATRG
jgi:hypothetical protein